MFGVIPRALWSKLSPPDDHNRIALDTNCVLLRDGERTVLIESGYGNKFSKKEREIFAMEDRTVLNALDEINVDASDISHVIVTHLHFDHAGGLTRLVGDSDEIALSFPNARVIVQEQEWRDAKNNRSTMTKTYLATHLDPIADRVELISGAAEVLPGITVSPAPGHTWGQQAVHWADDQTAYVFPGDLCPTRAHAHPAASMAYDVEPWTNMNEKARLLDRCAESGRLIVLDHDPDNPVVKAQREAIDGRGSRIVLQPLT